MDFCEELGRKEEAKRKEREAMFAQGYQKRVQYEQQGIRSVSKHTNTQTHTRTQQTHLYIVRMNNDTVICLLC